MPGRAAAEAVQVTVPCAAIVEFDMAGHRAMPSVLMPATIHPEPAVTAPPTRMERAVIPVAAEEDGVVEIRAAPTGPVSATAIIWVVPGAIVIAIAIIRPTAVITGKTDTDSHGDTCIRRRRSGKSRTCCQSGAERDLCQLIHVVHSFVQALVPCLRYWSDAAEPNMNNACRIKYVPPGSARPQSAQRFAPACATDKN